MKYILQENEKYILNEALNATDVEVAYNKAATAASNETAPIIIWYKKQVETLEQLKEPSQEVKDFLNKLKTALKAIRAELRTGDNILPLNNSVKKYIDLISAFANTNNKYSSISKSDDIAQLTDLISMSKGAGANVSAAANANTTPVNNLDINMSRKKIRETINRVNKTIINIVSAYDVKELPDIENALTLLKGSTGETAEENTGIEGLAAKVKDNEWVEQLKNDSNPANHSSLFDNSAKIFDNVVKFFSLSPTENLTADTASTFLTILQEIVKNCNDLNAAYDKQDKLFTEIFKLSSIEQKNTETNTDWRNRFEEAGGNKPLIEKLWVEFFQEAFGNKASSNNENINKILSTLTDQVAKFNFSIKNNPFIGYLNKAFEKNLTLNKTGYDIINKAHTSNNLSAQALRNGGIFGDSSIIFNQEFYDINPNDAADLIYFQYHIAKELYNFTTEAVNDAFKFSIMADKYNTKPKDYLNDLFYEGGNTIIDSDQRSTGNPALGIKDIERITDELRQTKLADTDVLDKKINVEKTDNANKSDSKKASGRTSQEERDHAVRTLKSLLKASNADSINSLLDKLNISADDLRIDNK